MSYRQAAAKQSGKNQQKIAQLSGGETLNFTHNLQVSDVEHWGSQIIGSVCKGAMGPILTAMAPRISGMDTQASLVVAEVILPLHIP